MKVEQLDDVRFWAEALMHWIEEYSEAYVQAGMPVKQVMDLENCLLRAIDMLSLNRQKISLKETFASKLTTMIA